MILWILQYRKDIFPHYGSYLWESTVFTKMLSYYNIGQESFHEILQVIWIGFQTPDRRYLDSDQSRLGGGQHCPSSLFHSLDPDCSVITIRSVTLAYTQTYRISASDLLETNTLSSFVKLKPVSSRTFRSRSKWDRALANHSLWLALLSRNTC